MKIGWSRTRRLRRAYAAPAFTALWILSLGASGIPAHAYKAPPGDDTTKKTATTANGIDPELAAAIAAAPTATQWPNSDYARILDLGNVTIKSDGTIVAEYRETYKLFNERARFKAEVELPYNSSYQSIKVVRARTISKNGKITEVKPEDIRSSSPFSDYLMYDDAMAVNFSMPAIEDDCVIDYTYQMVTRPLLLPGQFWTYWGFSGPEPVQTCRYVLHAPADKQLKIKLYNANDIKPTVVTSKDGHEKTYTWEADHLNPIAVEPAMPPYDEAHSWMEISSIDSWQDIAKWFWTLEQPQAVATDAIRATVKSLVTNKMTDNEKARAIYDWVANRTRYVGLEFGISAFRPHPAADVHDKLYGDCKDKATLLITMLREVGIKAHPVLLQAENRSPVSDRLPSLSAFNHCIAVADISGKEVWLDATAETCAYGDIPDGDRGVQAFVISDGSGKFETIPRYQPTESGLDMKTAIQLNADGSAEVKSDMDWRGAAAQSWRATIRSISPDKRKQVMEKLSQAFSVGAKVKDYTLPDGTDKNGPFVMGINIMAPNWAKKTGSLLLLPISGWLSGERSNPFVQDKRVWPIVADDTGADSTTLTVTAPDGYVLEDMPEDVNLNGPFQEFHRKITKSADGKTITVHMSTLERPGRVPAGDYAKVKAYYDSILKIADDQIVLKKK